MVLNLIFINFLMLISLFAFIMVIILIKFIYRHNPHNHEQFGNEIVLFHSDERYKKRIYRFHLIEDLKNFNKNKSNGALQLKLVMGEFSQESQEIVKHAVNNKFESIEIIAGPKVFCEDRTEIYTLLDKYTSIKYFILPIRPTKHFIIFNKNHLYIEKPHRHNKSRGSVGIKKTNPNLIEIYNKAFNEMLKYAKPLTKNEVMTQNCYKN